MLSKGRDISEDEKIALAKKVCDLYATDKYTLISCLKKGGIKSHATWHNWRKEIDEIERLYNEAIAEKKKNYRASLTARARTMLEKHLEGYTIETTEKDIEVSTGEDGKEVRKVVRIKERQIHVRPVFQATTWVLTTMNDPNFDLDRSTLAPTDIDIKVTINRPAPPVLSEDDIVDEDG